MKKFLIIVAGIAIIIVLINLIFGSPYSGTYKLHKLEMTLQVWEAKLGAVEIGNLWGVEYLRYNGKRWVADYRGDYATNDDGTISVRWVIGSDAAGMKGYELYAYTFTKLPDGNLKDENGNIWEKIE